MNPAPPVMSIFMRIWHGTTYRVIMSTTMRCVLVTTKLNFERAAGSVVDLHLKARWLVENGHDVTVVTAFSKNNRSVKNLPYRLCEERIPSGRFVTIQSGIYRILKKYEHEADIFYIDGHVFCYGAGWYRMTGGKVPIVGFFNIKLTGWDETPPLIKKRLRSFIEKKILIPLPNKLDAFIFTTPYVAALYEKNGFDMKKAHVLLDFSDGEVINRPLTKKAGEQHEALHFFASGRLIPEKGFDLLIRAFARSKNTAAKLTISGGGPEGENLRRLANELHVVDRIHFPGWVEKEDLYKLMDNADVFVFPRWIIEYSSVLLMEAMKRGLPPIIPHGGGLEWIAKDAGTAFIDGDEASLRDAIDGFSVHPGNIRDLSEKAIKQAKTFDWRLLGKQLEKIMLETLG